MAVVVVVVATRGMFGEVDNGVCSERCDSPSSLCEGERLVGSWSASTDIRTDAVCSSTPPKLVDCWRDKGWECLMTGLVLAEG